MTSIKFYIQTDKNPAGIYVRLRDGRSTDAKAKTKYAINPKEWSKNKGQPINLKDAELKKLNQNLSDFQAKLLSHYNNSVSDCQIDSKWLKDFIHPKIQEDAIPTKLIDYFPYFLKHRESAIEKSSYLKYMVVMRKLERFQEHEKEEFQIRDVNANFKLKFDNYCKKEGYAQNTTARDFKFIKTICINAQSNGIETHPQLNQLRVKTEKSFIVFLSTEEIEKIQNTNMPSERLENARDWLVISCEVGQRVSDFLNFTKEMIRYQKVREAGSEREIPMIEFTQVKTKKIMAVTLSKVVFDILKIRGGFPQKISAQKYNKYIKEVCKIVGLTKLMKGGVYNSEMKRKVIGTYQKYELITSHVGRRSFATNNYGKEKIEKLRNVTGHSTDKMFLEYIGKTQLETAIDLAKYTIESNEKI